MKGRIRVGLLLAAAALAYANSLPNGFSFDDNFYILHNQAVTTASLPGLFRPTGNNVFRPVTMTSFALNWVVGGARPFGYHLVNLLLHAGVVLLLYLVLQVLLEAFPNGPIVAFVAALLFAVHPLHTEAVASIVGRSELLAAGFLLAAWLLHLGDKLIPALLCFLLALLSKESALVFVPMVLAGDCVRGKWKPCSRYGWIVGFASLYLILFWKLEGGRFGERSVSFLDNPLASLPVQLRIFNALRIAWKYVGLHVYPLTLSYDYSYNAILLYANWSHGVIAVGATLGVLGLWVWALWSRRREWFLAGAIYLASFAVSANILLPTGTIMGERLAYLPSAGFCLLVALVWSQIERRRAGTSWALLGILVAALATRTVVRNRDWKNNFTLFSSGVRAVPGSARVHRNLGDEYARVGQIEEARAEFRAALRIYPDYPEAMENYGLLESRMGNREEAGKILQDALSMTSRGSPDHEFMEVNLATNLILRGQNEKALKLLDEAIADAPGYSRAWSNRAVIHYQRGEAAAARADAETAFRLDKSNEQARNVLRVLDRPAAGLQMK
jgi:protein O-mannosyl-transferase